jgi:hypothetical protein
MANNYLDHTSESIWTRRQHSTDISTKQCDTVGTAGEMAGPGPTTTLPPLGETGRVFHLKHNRRSALHRSCKDDSGGLAFTCAYCSYQITNICEKIMMIMPSTWQVSNV